MFIIKVESKTATKNRIIILKDNLFDEELIHSQKYIKTRLVCIQKNLYSKM